MHELPILLNITIALVAAFIGGLAVRKIGLPPIVGYLLAGIVIGPFTPGFIGDIATIQELAELGVIFLMLGVGLHFSFDDLLKVRDIAIPGALLQMILATLAGFGLSRFWGWSVPAGIVLGLAVSVASTVVLLRGLMDNSLLNTPHGQAAVGWLVMEDILSVMILVFMPVFSGHGEFNWTVIGTTLLKIAAFGIVMFVLGKKFIPWLLERIAHTRSRELFLLAVLAITLGTALGSAKLFGISLALGAFVAGAIISQSHLSHQVGADINSFKDAFAVLFFVSVGMLVNPVFLWQNLGLVVALSLLIILGKLIITLFLGTLFPHPAQTFIVIAVGLSQIGEFSFILGQEGVLLNYLSADQYSLILAGSIISIALNPFMYRLVPLLNQWLRNVPFLWKRLDRHDVRPILPEFGIKDHVVIIGYGQVGCHLVDVLEMLHVPQLVIETEAAQIEALNKRGIPSLFGDAANSEVIKFARLETAALLVITIPDESSTALIVTSAKDINPNLRVIARASSMEGINTLTERGANHIVHPELEGGLEILSHTLLELNFPLREVHQYTEAIRHDRYNTTINTPEEFNTLQDMLTFIDAIDITWTKIPAESPLIGQSLSEANIRAHTGASIVALIRDGHITANPKSSTIFEIADRIGLIGDHDNVEAALQLIRGTPKVIETGDETPFIAPSPDTQIP